MSTRTITCTVLACDVCGEDLDYGDYTPHDQGGPGDELRETAVDAYDWTTDGKHDWCLGCKDKPHTCSGPADATECVRCGSDLNPDEETDRDA